MRRPDPGKPVNKPHPKEHERIPEVHSYQLHTCGEVDDPAIGIVFFDESDRAICETHMSIEGAEDYVCQIVVAIRHLQNLQGKKEH